MKRPDGSPRAFGPQFDRVAYAAVSRRQAIVQRLSLEARAGFAGLQEALRTAGVVLAVLRIVDLHDASWWLINALVFAPVLSNLAILGAVLLVSRISSRSA